MNLIRELIDYVKGGVSVLPLIAAHLLYPPLSYIHRLEGTHELLAELYKLYPIKYLKRSFISSFMLRPNSWKQDSPFAWVSHLFIHGSYGHLLGNLQGLWSSAVPIYKRLGAPAVYFAFFGGGIFAALPSKLQSLQLSRGVREIDRSVEGISGGSVLGTIAKPFLAGGAKLARSLTEFNLRGCGSSGAVYSLWGLSTVLLVDELLNSDGCDRTAPGGKLPNRGSYDYSSKLISTMLFCSYVAMEAGSVFGTSEKGLLEAVLGQGQSIGHSAHLQGAIFGSLLGIFYITTRTPSKRNDKYSHL